MLVRLRRSFFYDGVKFEAGEHSFPDSLRGHLPSTAEVLDGKVGAAPSAPSSPPKVDTLDLSNAKLKGYAGMKKIFGENSLGVSITGKDILRQASRNYIMGSPGLTVDDWNGLKQDERKSRINAVAKQMLE